jgi:hypothetical protein
MNSADMASLIPDPNDLLKLDSEEQGRLILTLLARYDSPQKTVAHSNFFNRAGDPPGGTKYGSRQGAVDAALMVAWSWLENRSFLVKSPSSAGSWFFVSDAGRDFLSVKALYEQLEGLGLDRVENELKKERPRIGTVSGGAKEKGWIWDWVRMKKKQGEAGTFMTRQLPLSRKVFVVHGHDEGVREKIARFLEKLDFEPIILHEQASRGRTVIEKVEAHSDVGFAVVLLTPDDEGCERGGTPRPRARQNVVLELGYFVGHLGRTHVCALKRGEIEIPSDFHGVVYGPSDNSDGWKQALGRELEGVGFTVDWNKAMGPHA